MESFFFPSRLYKPTCTVPHFEEGGIHWLNVANVNRCSLSLFLSFWSAMVEWFSASDLCSDG